MKVFKDVGKQRVGRTFSMMSITFLIVGGG